MKVVFLCVANSARSQMAEALARKAFGLEVEVASAGSRPSFVHPVAIEVLAELDIDHSKATSKGVDDVDWNGVDFVITLCEDEVCPLHIGSAKKLHWPFPDPAGSLGTHTEKLTSFRTVRDQIAARLEEWLILWRSGSRFRAP